MHSNISITFFLLHLNKGNDMGCLISAIKATEKSV